MSEYTFSVIIPAHNEEKYIGKCIEAVKRAAKKLDGDKVQIIVSAKKQEACKGDLYRERQGSGG